MHSQINLVYPGFWSNPALLLFGLVGSLVYAYVLGYVFAAAYNWSGKK